jgi:hypothetical protein
VAAAEGEALDSKINRSVTAADAFGLEVGALPNDVFGTPIVAGDAEDSEADNNLPF